MARAKIKALLGQITKDADDKPAMIECISVALLRDKLVPSLKSYVDSSRWYGYNEFMNTCEEWEKVQPTQTFWFKKTRVNVSNPNRSGSGNSFQANRKPMTCYNCGKSGHMSRECRSRPLGEAATAPVATAAPVTAASSCNKPDVVCFRCKAKGHKSPDCPSKPKSNRRVQIPDREKLVLQSEEMFGSVNSCGMSVTIDTGAQISIVPVECVEPSQMVGRKQRVRSFQGSLVEGEACIVEFTFGKRIFERKAVAVEGSLIN